jgi:hypothetical protein
MWGRREAAHAAWIASRAALSRTPDAAPSTVAPTIEAAKKMGEKGAPHSEPERLLYEAYCKGHCWAVGPWVINPKTDKGEYYEMIDRIRFAMWRDRAALAAAPTPVADSWVKTDEQRWQDERFASRAAAKPISVDEQQAGRYVKRYEWLRRRVVMMDFSDDVVITITAFKEEGPTGEFLDDQIDTALAEIERIDRAATTNTGADHDD